MRQALALAKVEAARHRLRRPRIPADRASALGTVDYEAFIAGGDPDFDWRWPADEWEAISLNYTSGTTGNPKGVVYHHRGAYLIATRNIVDGACRSIPSICGRCRCSTATAGASPGRSSVAGRHARLPAPGARARPIFDAIAEHKVTHLCGAPIVMSTLLNAPRSEKRPLSARRAFDHRRRPAAGRRAGGAWRKRASTSRTSTGSPRPTARRRSTNGTRSGTARRRRRAAPKGAPGRPLSWRSRG